MVILASMHRVEPADDQNLPVCAQGCHVIAAPPLSPNQSFSTTLCPSSWPADAVKSLKERVSLSNTLVASQNTSTGALPRFSPVQADRRRSGVTEKYSQAQGSGSGA